MKARQAGLNQKIALGHRWACSLCAADGSAGSSDAGTAARRPSERDDLDAITRAPEAAGQGIASRLYDVMEAAARQQGITSLFTEASELARRLFERKGFVVVERQDLVVRGVTIHNYRMAKALDLTTPHLNWPGGPDCPELVLSPGPRPWGSELVSRARPPLMAA